MRNAVSLLKHYPPRTTLSRKVALALVVAALGLTAPLAGRPSSAPPSALTLPGHPDPGLAAILLPRHAPKGAYRLAIIDQPIEGARATVMAGLAPTARVDDPPGAWAVRQTDPLEAFGEGGIYDRARLARLFAGKPAHVVRGPVERDGRVVASVTLLSPCPDAQLSRLSPSTIVILFDAAAARR